MHTLKINENIPLELILLLSSYVNSLAQKKVIDAPVFNALLAPINNLTEALTGLERILMTPIPQSYQIHLQHVIYIYLFLLPSQIHSAFGYLTIPATALAAFVFLGFLEIGVQIENRKSSHADRSGLTHSNLTAFGYDSTDLNLDSFVHVIFKELNEITSHSPSETAPASYVFSPS